MTDQEESRDEVEEIIHNGEPIKEEAVIETIIEEEEVKPQAKPKTKSRAKPKIKITKEPIEPIEEEPIVEEEPAPVKVDKLKQIVKCPDFNMDMTVHTLKYIHTRRVFCKAIKAKPEARGSFAPPPEPEQPKPKITEYSK